jgi:protein-S-isoprenylcysteine O-methyltransferase Ste14
MQIKDNKFVPLMLIQVGAAVLILAVIVFFPGDWNAYRWAGLIIGAPGAIFLIAARYELGRSFSVSAQARELVTGGVYSKIRNPIYVFGAMLILGFILALQKPVLLVILVVVIPVQVVRARKEAKVLEARFGDDYREYRKKTWF